MIKQYLLAHYNFKGLLILLFLIILLEALTPIIIVICVKPRLVYKVLFKKT